MFLRRVGSVPLCLLHVYFPRSVAVWAQELLEMLSQVSFCWFQLCIPPRESGLRWGGIPEQTNSQQYSDAELAICVRAASLFTTWSASVSL